MYINTTGIEKQKPDEQEINRFDSDAIDQIEGLEIIQELEEAMGCCGLLQRNDRFPVNSLYDHFLEAFTYYTMYGDENVRNEALSCIDYCLRQIESKRFTAQQQELGEEPGFLDMYLFELVYTITKRQHANGQIVEMCGALICDDVLRQKTREVTVGNL